MPNNQVKCFTAPASPKRKFIKDLNAKLPSQCVVDMGYEDGKFVIEVYSYPQSLFGRVLRIPATSIIVDDEQYFVVEDEKVVDTPINAS